MESAMQLFYQLSIADCKNKDGLVPKLEVLYEYAVFFLNTLGGKSYLLRRRGKIRLLTTYYSILTVYKAEQQFLNSHGLDIRPFAERLLTDLEKNYSLVQVKKYRKVLLDIKGEFRQEIILSEWSYFA